MNRVFYLVTLLFLFISVRAQQNSTAENIITRKNYFLLSLLQEDAGARQLLEKDTVLAAMLRNKMLQLSHSLRDCKNENECFAEKLQFSDAEIEGVSTRLKALYTRSNAVGLLTKRLFNSHNYILFEQLPAPELLIKAWEQDARGINFVIGVYAEGKKPHYPNIDSVSFNVNSNGYSRLLYSLNYLVLNECSDQQLFFRPSLTAALRLLEMNEREQAADYEPMEKNENKAAFERVKSIRWNAYKYSLIMIPGAGPEEPTVALSAEGMIRCRLAVLQFKSGRAPFILASGGKVHPYKTKYCEALEMKKFMVDVLHVPAGAILIDPHARHTTTNMRNAARLIYRYGIPFSKPAITCTTRGQSNMIETTLIARCLKELKEVPYKNGIRLSETVFEFYPLMEAMHINPEEPMDP
ncbi:MAG: YdcF family protein [Chitinophagaceae bacterium]